MHLPQGARRLCCALVLGALLPLAIAQAQPVAAESAEARLKPELLALGFANGQLPELKPAFGNYVDAVQVGNMLYLSSAAPQKPDGQFVKGRVPDQVSVADAVIAAKLACVRQLARMKLALGDLDRVKRVVYVRAKILSQPEFSDQTRIADACSSLYVTAFGEQGRHARTAEGMAAAPFNVTLEVDTFVELK
jgi:enamine deaminase RidA (YjgF/YER057c/UK114 family)